MKIGVMQFLPSNYQVNGLGLYDFFFFADEARRYEQRLNASKRGK